MNKEATWCRQRVSRQKTGLGRMELLSILVLCLAAVIGGCSFFEKKPDEELLKQRMEALVAVGWESVRLKNPDVLWMEKVRGGYLVSFKYHVVFTQDESAMTEEEKEKVRKFLPGCADIPLKKGNSCPVEESLVFVETENFGWMPEYVVEFSPQLLPVIANYTTEAKQP